MGQVLAEMLLDIKNICFSTMLCARLMQCNVSVAFVHYFIDQYLSSASPRIKTDFFKQIKRDAKRSFFLFGHAHNNLRLVKGRDWKNILNYHFRAQCQGGENPGS